VIVSEKLPTNNFGGFQIFLSDELRLSVEEKQRSPPLPLLEEQVPALERSVKRSA
jgi:hypothetical protein